MNLSDLLVTVPGAKALPDPEPVDHQAVAYFLTVTFRSLLSVPPTEMSCDATQVIADVVTDPGGGNPRVLANTASATVKMDQAELEAAIPGFNDFFTLLYDALTAKIAANPPPDPLPPPEPEP